MIFFTRELFQGYQPGSGRERRAMREWDRNNEIYLAYRHIIAPLLPRAVVRLTGDGLHDSVITHVAQRDGIFAMTLDTSGSFSRFRPRPVRLTFKGVKRKFAIRGLVGQWWLYDEVHLSSRAKFNLQVMLTDSELDFDVDDVKIERLKRLGG
jgi:hypothetical protein